MTLASDGTKSPGATAHGLVVGSGALLLWLTALRYLEFSRSTYSIVLTLQRAAPRVLVFVAGAMPLFLAYVSFAVVVFGPRVPEFAGVRRASITLFSVLNGDSVLDAFGMVSTLFPVSGQLFLYSFISLFIYVVLNILVALVEEAFFQSSEETEAILLRQRQLQGLAPPPPAVSASSNKPQRLQSSRTVGWQDLLGVDVLAEGPGRDLDSIQAAVSGQPRAWRTAMRLHEWDEVSGQATVAAALQSASGTRQ